MKRFVKSNFYYIDVVLRTEIRFFRLTLLDTFNMR